MSSKQSNQYHQDFYAWAMYNAELIRKGKLAQIDFENVAEEIESIGKSERRELVNRFAILIAHLLKWQFQPERCGNNWMHTIKYQRLEVIELLEDSPSLKHVLNERLAYAYGKGINLVIEETGLTQNDFPKLCPYPLEDILKDDFLPD